MPDLRRRGVPLRRVGTLVAGFCAIDRKDFGLAWNQVLETGGLLVGDAVKLAVDIAAVKGASAHAA